MEKQRVGTRVRRMLVRFLPYLIIKHWHTEACQWAYFSVIHRIGFRISFSSCVLLLTRPHCIHEVYSRYHKCRTGFLLHATNRDNLDTHDSCLSIELCKQVHSECKRSIYSGPSSSKKTPSKIISS